MGSRVWLLAQEYVGRMLIVEIVEIVEIIKSGIIQITTSVYQIQMLYVEIVVIMIGIQSPVIHYLNEHTS